MSISVNSIINNSRGIHARPSAEIAKEAGKYKSVITIRNAGNKANAKDVLQLIIIELFKGTEVEITADGEDEEIALNAIRSLVEKCYEFD